MVKKCLVKLTANFERNLESIEAFLIEANALQVYQTLLDELLMTVIPNLEMFPYMGKPFSQRPQGSAEVVNADSLLQVKLRDGDLREYVHSDYLILYVSYDNLVYLLSIKHHLQLSFDLAGHW